MVGKEQKDSAMAVMERNDEAETPQAYQEKLKEVLSIDAEDVGVLRKKLTITIPRSSLQDEFDKQYKDIISEAVVPGFRRGRAPRRLVEKRFGQEIGAQVQTKIMSNAYLAAVDKASLKVLGDPLVWIPRRNKDKKAEAAATEELVDMPTAIEHLKVPDEGDYSFKVEVELKPDFELPPLDGVEVAKPQLSITEEDVDKQIERLRAIRGQWTPVLEEGAKIDDMLICDLRVTVGDEEVKSGQNVQLAARGQMIEGVAFEDFGEKIKGAKAGDRRTFEGTLPEDHPREDLRGKQATFEVTVQDVKRLKLPELDKEFLSAHGFESMEEYREAVKTQMNRQLKFEIQRGLRGEMRKYLLENTKLDLPEGLSSRQTERAILRTVVDLSRRGVPEAEISKHADELRTSAKEQAILELKSYFIMEAIAEKLEVDVTEEEINAQIAEMSRAYNRRFDRVRDELARNNGIESLYLEIRDEKCVDKLLETAKIIEKPAEEIAKEAKKAKKADAAPKKAEAKAAETKEEKESKAAKPREAAKTKEAAKPKAAPRKKKSESNMDDAT